MSMTRKTVKLSADQVLAALTEYVANHDLLPRGKWDTVNVRIDAVPNPPTPTVQDGATLTFDPSAGYW